jgi:hypothetical protein
MVKIFSIISLLFCFSFFYSCAQGGAATTAESKTTKINGISFVASPQEAKQENVTPVLGLNANYASVMPFGFIRSIEHPEIMYNTERQWFGETKAGTKQYVDILKKNNIQVMLKPQIWISHGEFTGNLKMDSEENWKIFEDSYRNFILEFAKLAQEENIAIFCIGTELEQFILNRNEYWHNLILDIRKVFKGKLTYAANWDEYKRVPFWKQLDYIGVDAYFPISESKTPTVEESKVAWQSWKEEMKSVSEKENKDILFAEYGYRSVDFAGKEPWNSDYEMTSVNLDAQANLTQVLFKEIWNEEWFAGGFIWKWHMDHKKSGGLDDTQFTPQNKPVESVVREVYKQKK